MRLNFLPIIPFISLPLCFQGCKPAVSDIVVETVDTAYIRQLPQLADTFYDVTSGAAERTLGAVNAVQYNIGGGQKTLTLHFDPTGIVIAMQERRLGKTVDSVAFYTNGQRMNKLQFDANGLADGPARQFYSDGRVKADGPYLHGIKTGIWRQFNEAGKLVLTEEYDKYGNKTR